MKINFFAVNNFRGLSGGLERNKIVFKDTNTLFIFGQNNTGKSTFLQAYLFFYEDKKPQKEDYYRQDSSNIVSFEIEVNLDNFDLTKIDSAAPNQKKTFRDYLENDSILRLKTEHENKEQISSTWNPKTKKWDKIGYGSIGLHQVFQSCMPKPIFIKAMPTEEDAKATLNDILKILAESTLKETELEELKIARDTIKKLQNKMYKPDIISRYEDSVNNYFKQLFPSTNIKIKDKKDRLVWSENKLGKEFDIEFNNTTSTGKIDTSIPTSYNSVGHGTIRTAIFTLLLMKDIAEEFERKPGRKDYIVLFEEPELFLYPKIIMELRTLIYKVSEEDLPYQLLCASHSPQMIDISKPKSSIIRLVKSEFGTTVYQINDAFLKEAKEINTDSELRQEMLEILRFNPFVCESFYADEVILVEGPTEEIIIRGFLQENNIHKKIFVLNCGSVTNIPFYQKIFSKFEITYNVICDTEGIEKTDADENNNPIFGTHIQGTISTQFHFDKMKTPPNKGLFRVLDPTFEPAHQNDDVNHKLRFQKKTKYGKPYNANLYWKETLRPSLEKSEIDTVPIIKYLKDILNN